MFRPRLIPVLLIDNGKLVKTKKFTKPVYLGDPLNAVKIFNELQADELVILDISARKNKSAIAVECVKQIGEEANMPISIGGGVSTLEHAEKLMNAGAERIVLSSDAINNPNFVKSFSENFGSSATTICIDYKKKFWGKNEVLIYGGKRKTGLTPEEAVMQMQEAGAGEIILQCIDRDGTMQGYDIATIKQISEKTSIPLIPLGGAGSLHDFQMAFSEGMATGMAAGSFFVFKGSQRGVLINYPDIKLRNFAR